MRRSTIAVAAMSSPKISPQATAEREVRGEDQAAAFVSFGEDLEDELGGTVGQREIAQLVALCGYPHSHD